LLPLPITISYSKCGQEWIPVNFSAHLINGWRCLNMLSNWEESTIRNKNSLLWLLAYSPKSRGGQRPFCHPISRVRLRGFMLVFWAVANGCWLLGDLFRGRAKPVRPFGSVTWMTFEFAQNLIQLTNPKLLYLQKKVIGYQVPNHVQHCVGHLYSDSCRTAQILRVVVSGPACISLFVIRRHCNSSHLIQLEKLLLLRPSAILFDCRRTDSVTEAVMQTQTRNICVLGLEKCTLRYELRF
jgi:hypothetical protein